MSNSGTVWRRIQGRAAPVAAPVLLAVGYPAQLLGVLAGSTALVVAGAVTGVLCELLLGRRLRGPARRFEQAQLSLSARQLLRDALLLGGLSRLGALRPAPYAGWLLVALLGCWALHFVCQGVAFKVRAARRLPVLTRNVDVSGLRLSPAPPGLFARRGPVRVLSVSALLTVGMAVTAGTGDVRWAAAVALVCWAGLAAGVGHMAAWLRPGRRLAGEEAVLEWLDEWLAAYRPTVGMYFSGGTTSAYQANMWLSTLAGLEGNPVIILRERFMMQKIEATDVPVICIPKVAHLMHLEHSTLRVLLHPANSGKTSQVLRIPTIKHAFINHGESDKLSSCNPYAKAYDQVWVAGPAARQRYQLADIGVDDHDVVEVGRPQLAPITPHTGPPTTTYTTVLYAPTWEGWTNDPGNTSVILAGENITAALLADPTVRLLYKPHPMTGSVDPRAAAANHRIQALIREANTQRAAQHPAQRPGPEAETQLAAATAELEALTTTAFRRGADEVEKMKLQSTPAPDRAEAVTTATHTWQQAHWASFPEWEHQIITRPRPAIYTCFNQAHLLISDVSSVVSDYLTSEKPYAVANTTGLSEDDFRAGFPTVRAATILSPDAHELPHLLHALRQPEKDELAEARAELKVHLLGPAEPPSMARFNQAALDLGKAADERNERVARRTEEIPGQRETGSTEAHEAREAAEEAELDPNSGNGTPSDPEEADQVTA